jgi:hypothetical protein
VVRFSQVIAVENPRPIAFEQGLPHAVAMVDQFPRLLRRKTDQSLGGPQFDQLELSVEHLKRDGHPVALVHISRPGILRDSANDLNGQFDDRGKQQFALVLDIGNIAKQIVQLFRSENILHQCPMHDTYRRRLDEPLKNRIEDHPDRPKEKSSLTHEGVMDNLSGKIGKYHLERAA